jgi:hypothetical protein
MPKVKVGMDPEFMVKYEGEYVYPRLGKANLDWEKLSEGDEVVRSIYSVAADEFGHCAEIRPTEAETGKELVLNMISAMAELPRCFTYHSDNTHTMPKKTLFKLVRSLGRKDLSESRNIYGTDILDDCPADIKARKDGLRLVFCGCHMHISVTEQVSIRVDDDWIREDQTVKVPVPVLVGMFDEYIFPALQSDQGFNVGRYRAPGFYEYKGHGGFEYRSLGASALTPTRILLVADIMIELTKYVLKYQHDLLFRSYTMKDRPLIKLPDDVLEMLDALKATKRHSGDLRALWVPFD